MKLALTNFSMKHPRSIIIAILAISLCFLLQFPNVKFDNDPENMLSADEPVRIFHHEIKQKYALYDFVIVGIVNEQNPNGIFNVETLNRLDQLTQQLTHLQQDEAGKPIVVLPASLEKPASTTTLDLTPHSKWKYWLGRAFNHDPNRLFDTEGRSAILAHELISPSVVDNIKQSALGSLKIEYLMEHPPRTATEARQIRDDAMNNPLYKGTLVSEDEKAVCLYIPIKDKTYSYNVANLVDHLTRNWPTQDQVFITGLPVAEDTFGIEMLLQMAISAPLAGLAIFILMLIFFRSISLIIAPMLVAIVSIICTMGLLIGLGYDVHIMSSMIAIFLMPISVADAVHILSEFFDTYPSFGDKAKTVRHVIGHLFQPMLYTSLTTIAGFASLAFTPIPPVKIFGLHIAFGVGLAWLLSMTMIPAYIMLFVSEKKLAQIPDHQSTAAANTNSRPAEGMLPLLYKMGKISTSHRIPILLVTLALIITSIYGITRIQVNDNPVKWFSNDHEIRVADKVLNHHFGGTYTAYLTLTESRPAACNCTEKSQSIETQLRRNYGKRFPKATEQLVNKLHYLRDQQVLGNCNISNCFYQLIQEADRIDKQVLSGWSILADEVNYLDPEGLNLNNLDKRLQAIKPSASIELKLLSQQLAIRAPLSGNALIDAALLICDEYLGKSFHTFIVDMEAELSAPPFKQPKMLRYVEQLQQHLQNSGLVGKSSSAVDALKKANYELKYRSATADANAITQEGLAAHNRANFVIPDKASAVAQVFVQLEGMKKKDSLFHMVTRDYRNANIWVQLKSGDNRDMEAVVKAVDSYIASHPAPLQLKTRWAGLTYLNVVWQDKMVRGMISSLLSSFIVVLIMMILLFRSTLWGLLAMVPLSITITMIYGIIGLVGKDYDMPVAVLSSLTLGLSVDFAIHFLKRARDLQHQTGNWNQTIKVMFQDPARAISRNAITISIGFLPLLLAPLVPYKTVGFFLATIMILSWLATLLILPSLLSILFKWAFPEGDSK